MFYRFFSCFSLFKFPYYFCYPDLKFSFFSLRMVKQIFIATIWVFLFWKRGKIILFLLEKLLFCSIFVVFFCYCVLAVTLKNRENVCENHFLEGKFGKNCFWVKKIAKRAKIGFFWFSLTSFSSLTDRSCLNTTRCQA